MKGRTKIWQTIYRYVHLDTGEVTEIRKVSKYERSKQILIIKQEKQVKYAHAKRYTTVTKYFRPNTQQRIEFGEYTTS